MDINRFAGKRARTHTTSLTLPSMDQHTFTINDHKVSNLGVSSHKLSNRTVRPRQSTKAAIFSTCIDHRCGYVSVKHDYILSPYCLTGYNLGLPEEGLKHSPSDLMSSLRGTRHKPHLGTLKFQRPILQE